MAQKKYRPGMNCEKTGKYTCYDKDGKEMYADVDVEKGRRFPPSQEEGCYYEEQQYLFVSVDLIQSYKKKIPILFMRPWEFFSCFCILRTDDTNDEALILETFFPFNHSPKNIVHA